MVKFPDSRSGDNRASAVARDLNVEFIQLRLYWRTCTLSLDISLLGGMSKVGNNHVVIDQLPFQVCDLL